MQNHSYFCTNLIHSSQEMLAKLLEVNHKLATWTEEKEGYGGETVTDRTDVLFLFICPLILYVCL